jgi:hypothetical protein
MATSVFEHIFEYKGSKAMLRPRGRHRPCLAAAWCETIWS